MYNILRTRNSMNVLEYTTIKRTHTDRTLNQLSFTIFVSVQAATQPFWCAPPDSIDLSNVSMDAWTNATPVCGTPNATALRQLDERLHDYRCDRYVFEGPHTVIAEWSLVCERFHWLSVVEMCFLAGAGVGSLCSGWLSDKFGRRHTLMAFVLAQSSLGESGRGVMMGRL